MDPHPATDESSATKENAPSSTEEEFARDGLSKIVSNTSRAREQDNRQARPKSPATGPQIPYSQLRWSQLSDDDKSLVRRSLFSITSSTLLCGGLAIGALVSIPRLLKRVGRDVEFGWGTKIMASILFPVTGAYTGLSLAGPRVATRILENRDSKLAKSIREHMDNRELSRVLAITQVQRKKERILAKRARLAEARKKKDSG